MGDILLRSGVPAVALQAAVIIGSGSASFEMLRYLTERLPVMVTPKWVETRIQPIAVSDVLRYLVGCAELPPDVNRRFDIGGPDIVTYAEMMRRYTEAAGLRPRVLVPVPLLTPRLSSLWVGLVTPVPSGLAMPLVESLRNEVVCSEHDIAEYVPDPPEGLLPIGQALALALLHTREGDVSTRWSSAATPGAPSDPLPSDPAWAGGSLFVDDRSSVVKASPEALWQVIEGIGGETGWYSFPLAWAVRGLMDRLAGGVGLRRGRRDPKHLLVGDALDFWRVEAITHGSLLRLRAEMKLPGWPGSSSRSARMTRTGPSTTSGPSSSPAARPASRTGGRSPRSTASSSAAWCRTSPRPPSAAAPGGPPPPRPLRTGKRPWPGPAPGRLALPDVRSGHVLGVPRRYGCGTPSRGRWAPAA